MRCALLLLMATFGCASDDAPAEATPCEPPARLVGERCLDPGVQDNGCPAGTWGDACQPAGVPLEGCAVGFASDGEGPCEPILPSDVCAYGQMAIPGESVCRPIMDCGVGRWGALPVDANTIYVDGAYAGGGNNGTEAAPWTEITDALSVAPRGALIAVAAGSYAEDVVISEQPVRLWGVCPDRVALIGAGSEDSALVIGLPFASGTEVGGIAVTGIRGAVFVSGAVDVTLDRVWVRDAPAYAGLETNNDPGVTAVTLRDSLVENNRTAGIYAGSTELTVARSVVRSNLPRLADMRWGRGLQIQPACKVEGCDIETISNAVIRSSVIEQNHESGITVGAAQALIEGSVVRNTLPTAATQDSGHGVAVTDCDAEEGCAGVVRGTAVLRSSHISNVLDAGVYGVRSDVTVEASVIRGVAPAAATLERGRGISLEGCGPLHGCAMPRRATGLIRGTLVEDTHDIGILVMGSEGTIEGSWVRRTMPQLSNSQFGRGISAQLYCLEECDPAAPAHLTVVGSRIDESHQFGVAAVGSEATLEALAIRATVPQAADGLFGDGVLVAPSHGAPALASIANTWIEESARAGVAVFGATGTLANDGIACASIPVVQQNLPSVTATLADHGGNRCGCPGATDPCQAVSAGIDPPPALDH